MESKQYFYIKFKAIAELKAIEYIAYDLDEFGGTFSMEDTVKDSKGQALVCGEAIERMDTNLAGYILTFSPSDPVGDTYIYVGLQWPPQVKGKVIRSLPCYWTMAE